MDWGTERSVFVRLSEETRYLYHVRSEIPSCINRNTYTRTLVVYDFEMCTVPLNTRTRFPRLNSEGIIQNRRLMFRGITDQSERGLAIGSGFPCVGVSRTPPCSPSTQQQRPIKLTYLHHPSLVSLQLGLRCDPYLSTFSPVHLINKLSLHRFSSPNPIKLSQT